MILFFGSLQLGLLYALMAIGIYISFRILNTPDLTVDGSFALGMAITAVVTALGHPILALFIALILGAFAGIATGVLQTKFLIHPILSGILVMTSLYTVNLAIMGGKSNVSVVMYDTYFTLLRTQFGGTQMTMTLFCALPVLLLLLVIPLFFKTRLGLAIRATGDNEDMVRASSINSNITKCIGLAIEMRVSPYPVGLSVTIKCLQMLVQVAVWSSSVLPLLLLEKLFLESAVSV